MVGEIFLDPDITGVLLRGARARVMVFSDKNEYIVFLEGWLKVFR